MGKPYMDYQNKILQSVLMELISDDMLSKLLYYTDVNDEDIYSLKSIDNPILTLYKNPNVDNNKVFKNKKVLKVIEKIDACMFVNLVSCLPQQSAYSMSSTINTITIQIGILCHEKCLDTINGSRDIAMMDRIISILNTNELIKSIGTPMITSISSLLDIPYDFNGYGLLVTLDGIRELDLDER